jgi:hypothetical protein
MNVFSILVKGKFNYAYTQEFPYRTNHILECEFYLLEHLDCCLIVYQPYRPLLTLIQDVGPDDQLLTLAWRIINDSLRTDVCLLYPPYQIAIGKPHYICLFFFFPLSTMLQRNFKIISFFFLRLSTNSLRDITKGPQIMVRRIKCRYGKDSRNSAIYNKFVRIMEKVR